MTENIVIHAFNFIEETIYSIEVVLLVVVVLK